MEINLVSDKLIGAENGDQDQVREWILNKLNSGCKINIFLKKQPELNWKNIPVQSRKTLMHLGPYAEEGLLKVMKIGKYRGDFEWLIQSLRVFTQSSVGGLMWLSDYHAPAILEQILPKPVYQMTVDQTLADILDELVNSSEPCPRDAFFKNNGIKRWEIKPGEKRKLDEYFSAVQGAHIEEIIIRDPYCGSGEENRKKLFGSSGSCVPVLFQPTKAYLA